MDELAAENYRTSVVLRERYRPQTAVTDHSIPNACHVKPGEFQSEAFPPHPEPENGG
ncbi:hypothetical protein [Pseudomonas sp. NPDC088444]|uniref:hypothetical protein n=1 Tax=Pseudomonas sp. NPDC088444 TaxID=3364456 RepID=UPI00384AC2F1